MRTILFLMQKEFLQIFRNKAMLPVLLVMPIVQLIVLSHAATHEVKNIRLAVLDQDHSAYSQRLIAKLESSGHFILTAAPDHHEAAFSKIQSDEADLVVAIPPDLERNFLRKQEGTIQIQANAINGLKAGIAVSYANQVIQGFRAELVNEQMAGMPDTPMPPLLGITYSNWYNESLDYKVFMVPGILGELVTLLVMVLAAMNIVREREIGTIEQLNVTPIRKYQFIIGKLLPILLVGMFDLTIGLIVGKLFFQVPIEGSILLIFGFCLVNLIGVLGIGLLISTLAETQQQAMFISWFFMIVFILMSGLFTPIDSMPEWAQYLTVPNPVAHFVSVMRQALLKGSNFYDIQYHFWAMVVMGLLFSTLAVLAYRKRT
jgi:ABC-2 type transport system permease protein